MHFTKSLKNFFRLRRRGFRQTGYYWVRYSYGGARTWRIGWYNAAFENWQFDGDTRSYYDNDLISIREAQVMPYHTNRTAANLILVSIVVALVAIVLNIYSLTTIVTKWLTHR